MKAPSTFAPRGYMPVGGWHRLLPEQRRLLSHPCRTCHAPAGRWCRDETGRALFVCWSGQHEARYRAAGVAVVNGQWSVIEPEGV